MKKKIGIFLKYSLSIIFIGVAIIIYGEVKNPTELGRFRRTDDPFPSGLNKTPSRKGLDELHLSGSARVSQPTLQKALSGISDPVYVIDFQEEPHYFIQGLPEHWFGYNQCEADFSDKPGRLKIKHFLRRILRTGKVTHNLQDSQSEKEIVEELGYHYLSTQQTRHHIPTNEEVDRFLANIQSLPPKRWVHIHCSAGQGRTSIALVMFDIMKNGKEVPLEDIVERHHLLGSVDLFDTKVWKTGTYKKEMLETRKNFIINFYQYVNDPRGLDATSWSEWVSARLEN